MSVRGLLCFRAGWQVCFEKSSRVYRSCVMPIAFSFPTEGLPCEKLVLACAICKLQNEALSWKVANSWEPPVR